ncbi:ATP-dependent zinc metalloprotease FtsH [Inconstantimicrobium mannanitabidum]|uniref:ATP-dependent zinc metalloprotease FtsH n=1 Tax=Inconstantimicrobium mannanitabidum TaxID=1604901 RepID=A0ACB5RFI8_9CLOT|nr:ATP-dependent zinc metalloprotease FtsH [Clostridium sp. TW13]GKX67856.1 ATP-dependent zinc metalloprotease FtsH [Clostridium sp. TW13]
MFKDKKQIKYLIIYIAIAIGFIVIFNYGKAGLTTKKITYSEFKTLLHDNKIEKVTVGPSTINIDPKESAGYNGLTLYADKVVPDTTLVAELEKAKTDSGLKYDGAPEKGISFTEILIYYILPFIPIIIIGRLLFGRMDKKMGGGVMSFGKNTAKLYAEAETGVTFKDVAGQEEAKESLKEIVDFLHNPQKYVDIGAKLPKGALLVGPPGTGKTLLAKAVAGEAKVPFFSMSGSDFVEMFVGMGASRVRDLFKQAEEKAPCIVFIDEIDAIGKSREGSIQGNDEREQTLNQLLSEMDGFDSSKGVVILAATNRPEVLDKALLRPGRFDRRVIVDRPDLKGRIAILEVHSKDVKMDDEVNLEAIAKGTPGAVGADLANIVNEGAIRAVKQRRRFVIQEDLEEAIEVVIAGKEKKDRIMSPKEKSVVAYHEVGHALVAAMLNNTDPVHKITIVPRTMGALGYTMQLPEEEKYLVSRDEMLDEITVMLGGRSAEEVEFNIVSTGASNDIERASQSARRMITMYGMSDRFDMMGLEATQNRYLDGRAVMNCSEATATIIDEEVLNIIKKCHNDAKDVLNNNRDLLTEIADVLLEKETISGDEFMDIIYKKYPEKKAEREEKEKQKKLLEEEAKKKKEEREILEREILEKELAKANEIEQNKLAEQNPQNDISSQQNQNMITDNNQKVEGNEVNSLAAKDNQTENDSTENNQW